MAVNSLKIFILSLSIQIAFQPSAFSQSCSNLFLQNEIHQTQFTLTEQQVLAGPALHPPPLNSVETVGQALKGLLQSAHLKYLPGGSRFAISISHKNRIHLVK